VTPREYIDIVRERWRAILVGLLVGLLAAGAVIFLVPRQYAASATLLVTAQPAGPGASDTGEISAQRIGTYSELLKSKRLAAGVIAELNLAVPPDDLARRISVTNNPDSLLLTATVTDVSANRAVGIANAVADQFVRNVAQIEQPADPARPPLVAAKIFEPAQLPAEQVAPQPLAYVAVGAVAGLLLGFVAALLLHALDSRIRGRRQLEDILDAPVLGTIARDPKIAKSPLVMPNRPLAEAFRQLRTNVQFVDVERQHRVILVTSATAGAGRSTTVCNLGLAMAEAGVKVLIVDADLRKPTIARCVQIDGKVGLSDVLAERVPLERARQSTGPHLDVLPSGALPPNPSELLGSKRMTDLIQKLRTAYDVVLIDSAPLLPVADAAVLAPQADGVLVVVKDKTVGKDLEAAKEALDAVSARVLGAVMTMVTKSGSGARDRVPPWNGSRLGEVSVRMLGTVTATAQQAGRQTHARVSSWNGAGTHGPNPPVRADEAAPDRNGSEPTGTAPDGAEPELRPTPRPRLPRQADGRV
jgi:capsular exopolysaccharide synthesis family protein